MITAQELDTKFQPNKFTIEELEEAAGRILQERQIQHYANMQREVMEEMHNDGLREILTTEKIIANLQRIARMKEKDKRDDAEEFIEEDDRERFNRILITVCKSCNILASDIMVRRRLRGNLYPRYVLIFVTRWLTKLSLQEIGMIVTNDGVLHHSTIINTCAVVSNAIVLNDKEDQLIVLLNKTIRELYIEGLVIDLHRDQPDWYLRYVNP